MVDDVGAPEVSVVGPEGGSSGVDPKCGSSGVDVCEIAAGDHESMYLLDLEVNPYTAVFDGGQQMDVESHHIKIMVDPYHITVDHIIEKLKENIAWG
jgi:hypothetical protein